MILPVDFNPVTSLYYTGSVILGKIEPTVSYDFFYLFKVANESRPISLQLFILALDWLFLIGSICFDKHGNIIRCL